MQLRITRVHELKKMCLISKSLYRKVKTSLFNQIALSRQRNAWHSEDSVSWYILIIKTRSIVLDTRQKVFVIMVMLTVC